MSGKQSTKRCYMLWGLNVWLDDLESCQQIRMGKTGVRSMGKKHVRHLRPPTVTKCLQTNVGKTFQHHTKRSQAPSISPELQCANRERSGRLSRNSNARGYAKKKRLFKNVSCIDNVWKTLTANLAFENRKQTFCFASLTFFVRSML